MNHDCAYHRYVERMRQHREEFELAVREGLTLDAARERLASLREHEARLAADDPPPPAPAGEEPRALLDRAVREAAHG